jgi:hypothetical protein
MSIRPRFRHGEVVRLGSPPRDGVVEDLVGPAESGDGWAVSVRVGDQLLVVPEDELESTSPVAELQPERHDTIVLRLVTDLTDVTEAARAARDIEEQLRLLLGAADVSVEAERHWAEPFYYELDVTVRPHGDAVTALRLLVVAGKDGWLSCADDGWRCNLWWTADDDDPGFLVAEVRGAEVTLLPWSSPDRRPDGERPLVTV